MPKLTIELTPAKYSEIKILREVSEASTFKELINSALTLFKWALLERSKGYKICAVREVGDDTVIREVEMPALSSAQGRPDLADLLGASRTTQPAAAAAATMKMEHS